MPCFEITGVQEKLLIGKCLEWRKANRRLKQLLISAKRLLEVIRFQIYVKSKYWELTNAVDSLKMAKLAGKRVNYKVGKAWQIISTIYAIESIISIIRELGG